MWAGEVSTYINSGNVLFSSDGADIFRSAPVGTFSRTCWPKVVDSAAYSSITFRNANTALKLAG